MAHSPQIVRSPSVGNITSLEHDRNHALSRWESDCYHGPVTERMHWRTNPDFLSHNATRAPSSTLSRAASDALAMADTVFGSEDTDSSSVVDDQSVLSRMSDCYKRSDFASLPSSHRTTSFDSDSMPSLSDDNENSRGIKTSTLLTEDIRVENMRQTALVQHGPRPHTVPSSPRLAAEEDDSEPVSPDGMQCPFFFLNCPVHLADRDAWGEHCEAHLKRTPPPREILCKHCKISFAWQSYLEHIWSNLQGQHGLQEFDVDPQFFIHLRRTGIVEVAQYQFLLQDGRLGASDNASWRIYNPERERRLLHAKDRPSEPVIYNSNGRRGVRYTSNRV